MKILEKHFVGSRQIKLLIYTLVALVVADGLISKFLVEHGLGSEGNPFLQFWVSKDVFLVIKLLGAILIGILLWDLYRHHPKLSYISTLVSVVSYTAIVFWSLFTFFVTQM